jgi:hypothetical protein
MSDPLSLLREHFIQKQPMSHDDHNIFIGDLRFPRSTVTAYKQDRGRGDPYKLEALYFLLQKPHLAGAANTRAYNDETKSAGFPKVLLADQKDVLAYLQGKTETSQYLISIDELSAISAPTPQEARPQIVDRAGDKRQRDEAKLDILDDELIKAKRHLSERLSERALRVPEFGKMQEARSIVGNDTLEPESDSLPYVKADMPVTRTIVEKETTYPTNALVRQNYMLSKSGRDFSHLISLVRGALSGGAGSSSSAAGPKPAPSRNPPPAGVSQPTRYQMDQETAFKAAGIDPEIYKIQKRGLLSSVHPDPAAGPTGTPGTATAAATTAADRGDAARSSDRGKPTNPIILVPQAPPSAPPVPIHLSEHRGQGQNSSSPSCACVVRCMRDSEPLHDGLIGWFLPARDRPRRPVCAIDSFPSLHGPPSPLLFRSLQPALPRLL